MTTFEERVAERKDRERRERRRAGVVMFIGAVAAAALLTYGFLVNAGGVSGQPAGATHASGNAVRRPASPAPSAPTGLTKTAFKELGARTMAFVQSGDLGVARATVLHATEMTGCVYQAYFGFESNNPEHPAEVAQGWRDAGYRTLLLQAHPSPTQVALGVPKDAKVVVILTEKCD